MKLGALVVIGTLLLLPVPASAAGELEVVGRSDLGARGMNAALALAGHCAFVGSRGDGPVIVLDVSDPAHPNQVAKLGAHPGSTPRELRAMPASHGLAVLSYSLGAGPNQIDFYRWDQDCAHPARAGTYDFGPRRPHEFFLWVDAARPARALLFVAMFGSAPDLEVIDASELANPRSIGNWTEPRGVAAGSLLHSIALSDDGRRAYLSLWTGGFLVADSGDFAAGSAEPQLRLLTPPAAAVRYPPGNVHSAVPAPGRDLVVTTDERYPVPSGCPYGWGRLVDVADPAHPAVRGQLKIPESDAAACRAAPQRTWTSHNPTLTASLALISWYSGGLQVFDMTDAGHPTALAEYRPQGVAPAARDPQLGGGDSLAWSYPILRDGLIYMADINQGLLVLRYRGPHQEEIDGARFVEGNSNVRTAVASPTPTVSAPAPTVSAQPSPAPSSSAPASGARRQAALHPDQAQVLAGASLGALLLAAGVVWLRRRRQLS